MKIRYIALITVLILSVTLSSCCFSFGKDEADTSAENEVQTSENTGDSETVSVSEENTGTLFVPETTAVTEVPTSEAVTQPPVTEPLSTEAAAEDVSSWSTDKIVSFYKNAAEMTGNSVKSSQTVGLQDISVNNGQLGGVFSFVTPILSSFLSSSATETDGITGEFSKLTAEDVSSAKAYTCSAGTAVEITLNGQTDKGNEDRSDGSVAHGISVVGDLPSIMAQLKDKGLPLDVPAENTVLTYTNPVIKAVISEDGKIVNGTWSCSVDISLSDYKFAGSTVDSTKVVLDNKITVGGGFNP